VQLDLHSYADLFQLRRYEFGGFLSLEISADGRMEHNVEAVRITGLLEQLARLFWIIWKRPEFSVIAQHALG
jgi:hypothetical protein